MALQRQPTAPVPSGLPVTTCESPVETTTAQQIPVMVEDIVVQQPDDPMQAQELAREAARQTLFQKTSNGVLEVPNGYRKVEVTIIRWHESVDDFEGHTEEIEELRKVFVESFGFNCRIVKLGNNTSPQIELNYAILSQVRKHHEDDTLNIFYYTGHGVKMDGPNGVGTRLQLAATRTWSQKTGFPPTAFWDEAEQPLLSHVRCDILGILDCCFAGTAGLKGEDESSRSYQMITAAPPEGRTHGPGPKSFTHALCIALKELLQEVGTGTFRVDQLCERINTRRLTHASNTWNRLQKYSQHISLGRLEKTREREKSFAKREVEKASLLLRLYLKDVDLTDAQIVRLAKGLPQACKDANVPVRRIAWVGMDELKPGRRFQNLVHDAMKRNNTTPAPTQPHAPPNGSKKRTRSDPAPVPPKRRASGNLLQPGRRSSPRLLTPDSGADI